MELSNKSKYQDEITSLFLNSSYVDEIKVGQTSLFDLRFDNTYLINSLINNLFCSNFVLFLNQDKKMKVINYIFVIALAVLILSSCEDDTHVQGEHFELDGWVFLDNSGIKIIEIFQGQFNPNLSTEFNVQSGQKTEPIKLKFLDDHSDLMEPPTDTDYTLSWAVNDTTVAKINTENTLNWEFSLEGLKADTTSIQFFIMHGGHIDARSGMIKIRVE